MEKVIHLRYNLRETKYHLNIPLTVHYKDVEINEEVETHCSESETVGFLIEQAKWEIRNTIQEKLTETGNNVEIDTNDIDIYLRRKRCEGYKIIPEELTISVIMTQDHTKTRVNIFDNEYGLIVNAPKITNLLIPPILYAPYTVFPIKFEGMYIKSSLCKFKWYRSKDKTTWEEVGDEFRYSIKLEDVGHFLKLTCVPFSFEKIEGSHAEVISNRVVLEFPGIPDDCPFHLRHEYTKHILSDQSYRVVSYNTLSSRYTHHDGTYQHCPDEFLVIDYRKELILQEILGYNADIVCLQEIDYIEYNEFFKQALENIGFSSKFYPKGFYLSEGLMCAIRKTRFKLKSYELMVFCHAIKNKDMFEDLYRILKRDILMLRKVALQSTSMQVFEVKCKGKRMILIANIHLSHHPQNDDIRLIHIYMAVRYLNYLKERLENKHSNYEVNIILCGDLNSDPESKVFEFICKGELQPEDYLQIGTRRLSLRHNLRFNSACGWPAFTVLTPNFKGCVDYIFIEEGKTRVEQVVPFLEEEAEISLGLPNNFYPSDHLALVADINWKV